MVRRKFTLLAVALALPLLVVAGSEICITGPPTPESYTWDFKGETAQRLDETQWRAEKVRMSADRLESLAREPKVEWQSHANELTQVRAQVNAIGEDLCRMHIIQRETEPWQQETIDRITPEVVALAQNTEAAIEFVEENPANLWNPDYRAYVASMYEGADRLTKKADINYELVSGGPQFEKDSDLLAANYCGF